MSIFSLTDLAITSYEQAKEKGFWDSDRNFEELFGLIQSELCEAMEADRKNKLSNIKDLDDMTYKDGELFVKEYDERVKGTIQEELADVAIRLMDFCIGRFYLLNNNIRIVAELQSDTFSQELFNEYEIKDNFGASMFRLNRLVNIIYNNIFNTDNGYIMFKCYIPTFMFILRCWYDNNGSNMRHHIMLKLRYNKLRPYKHGKKY